MVAATGAAELKECAKKVQDCPSMGMEELSATPGEAGTTDRSQLISYFQSANDP